MSKPSFTSTDSFAARVQRSEAHRVVLWMVVLAGMILITLVRRWAGGVVMTDNEMFIPYVGVLVFAMICQVFLLSSLHRANRGGYLLPSWLWRGSAIFDLGTAVALLVISAYLSPRGAVAALSAPPLLLLPLVVLMSVLHLRPEFTLHAGLTGAAVHLLLAIRAVQVTHAQANSYPVYLAYSGILALTAFAGMLVCREIKSHVSEAAAEAAAHELADRKVFGMQRDLTVAREIQLGLLPTRPPELAGFDITGMNRPADQTGGDYYDWQKLPDGRLAVVLADVSGHGIGPALVMAVCRAYTRSSAPTTPDPAALLTRINELIHDDLPDDRFITLVIAVLDEDGNAHLISAGHGPTLLFRAKDQSVTQFGGDGMPLGIIPNESYGPTTSFSLDEGDVLVMLTDGFFEWSRPSDGEQFGIERLVEALRASATADAKTILRTIDESVCSFCNGTTQPDDMTAIVIKRAIVAGRA